MIFRAPDTPPDPFTRLGFGFDAQMSSVSAAAVDAEPRRAYEKPMVHEGREGRPPFRSKPFMIDRWRLRMLLRFTVTL